MKFYFLQLVNASIAILYFISNWGAWHSADSQWGVGAFLIPAWVASPYILIALLLTYTKATVLFKKNISILSVIVLLTGSLYLFINGASRDGLAGVLFLIVPVYQLLFISVVGAIALFRKD